MMHATALRAASIMQAPKPTTWANGITHQKTDAGDVYELPAESSGVAQRVELKPRLWGLLGQKVTVTDAQGQILEAHRRWEGFHKVVVATDPRTGLETVFDPKEQTAHVSTARTVLSTDWKLTQMRTRYTVEMQQALQADGSSRVVTNLRGEEETLFSRNSPGGSQIRNDQVFEETLLAPGGNPTTRVVESDGYGRRVTGSLASSLDAQGNLTIQRPDGSAQTYELFLMP